MMAPALTHHAPTCRWHAGSSAPAAEHGESAAGRTRRADGACVFAAQTQTPPMKR
jgi:hypothetical protein